LNIPPGYLKIPPGDLNIPPEYLNILPGYLSCSPKFSILNDFVATVSPPKINYDLCDLCDLYDFGLRRFNVSAQSEIITMIYVIYMIYPLII
jgi:hypothetical protein